MSSFRFAFVIACLTILSVQAAEKRKIEVFFESLCPACQQFIQSSFTSFSKAEGHSDLAEVIFYPYGNAHESRVGTKYQFTCQHGANECFGNLIETCAVNKFKKALQEQFLTCLESYISYYGNDFTKTANYCLTNYPTDKTNLWNCVKSDEGNQLQHKVAQATNALQPAHQYVPWIVVDGVHDSDAENAILEDMLSYLCQNGSDSQACQGRRVGTKFLSDVDNKCYAN